MKAGMCRGRACLAPTPCPNLDADHTDYLMLLRKIRQVPGVKKVFIRSGIRFDYMLQDKSGEFFAELVKYHVSGQLKVAPEHCVSGVLDYMGKPHIEVYEKFKGKYERLNQKYGKEQYLVPYLMSSHPGCTLDDAVRLAEWINRTASRSRCRTSTPRREPCPPACTTPALIPAPCSRCMCPVIPTRRRCSGR